jgi:hypothetical protein
MWFPDAVHFVAKELNQMAGAMGREVDAQNKLIGRVANKVDKVDDGLAVNRAKLERIR